MRGPSLPKPDPSMKNEHAVVLSAPIVVFRLADKELFAQANAATEIQRKVNGERNGAHASHIHDHIGKTRA